MNKKIQNRGLVSLSEADFSNVLDIIQKGKTQAVLAVNVALVDTYWNVGHYLFDKMSDS